MIFFPNVISEWNKLDIKIRNMASHNPVKKFLLSFIRPLYSNTFEIHNLAGIQFLTIFQMGLFHLIEHEFKQDLRDFLNYICACNLGPEKTSHAALPLILNRTDKSP